MDKVVAFLRARFAERSSRIQLVVLVLLGAVSLGYLSVDQIQSFSAQAMLLIPLLGNIVGVLMPDPAKPQDAVDAAAAAASAMQSASLDAVMRKVGPEAAAAVEAEVTKAADAVSVLAGKVAF